MEDERIYHTGHLIQVRMKCLLCNHIYQSDITLYHNNTWSFPAAGGDCCPKCNKRLNEPIYAMLVPEKDGSKIKRTGVKQ